MAGEGEKSVKANLQNLTKIPVSEFEEQFREWMERDDVARSLQAKLRCDLIANFNKTSLGKHILSQTSSMGIGAGNRLSLSPLILALNTLVAEFLYAQDCHFSLSVFCTEIPYRNTLPDFESVRHFRFSNAEITDIFQALYSTIKYDKNFKNLISKNYLEGGNMSLLFVILKSMIQNTSELRYPLVDTPLAAQEISKANKGTNTNFSIKADKADLENLKIDICNKYFQSLFKYLIQLTHSVKEMIKKMKDIYLVTKWPSRPLRSKQRNPLQSGNGDMFDGNILQHATEILKQLQNDKSSDKQVFAIINAAESMAKEFSKCTQIFNVIVEEINIEKTQKPLLVERGTSAEQQEKTYTDWIHEMRYTKNGQKFLDRIEVSLRKALNKQHTKLAEETEMKLRHQRELLRIRYNQKFLERISKHTPNDITEDNRRFNEYIDDHLKGLERRHKDLEDILYKNYIENCKKQQLQQQEEKFVEKKEKSTQSQPLPVVQQQMVIKESSPPGALKTAEVLKYVSHTQKQMQKMVESITHQERTIDHIVYDAKLRMQELENESNQLEQHFRDYLERQKLQHYERETNAGKILQNFLTESTKSPGQITDNSDGDHTIVNLPELLPRKEGKYVIGEQPKLMANDIEFTNAIMDAKRKLLTEDSKFKEEVKKDIRTGYQPSNFSDYATAILNESFLKPVGPKPNCPSSILKTTYSEFHIPNRPPMFQMKLSSIIEDTTPSTESTTATNSSKKAAHLVEKYKIGAACTDKDPTIALGNVAKNLPFVDQPGMNRSDNVKKNIKNRKKKEQHSVERNTQQKLSTTVSTMLQQSMAKMQDLFGEMSSLDGDTFKHNNGDIHPNNTYNIDNENQIPRNDLVTNNNRKQLKNVENCQPSGEQAAVLPIRQLIKKKEGKIKENNGTNLPMPIRSAINVGANSTFVYNNGNRKPYANISTTHDTTLETSIEAFEIGEIVGNRNSDFVHFVTQLDSDSISSFDLQLSTAADKNSDSGSDFWK